MIRNIITVMSALLAVASAGAQGRCTIKGEITGCDSLRYTSQKIRTLYLAKVDEFGDFVNIDSTAVVDRRFGFVRELAEGEPAMVYLITGFDNGAVNLFVEPGEVSVDIHDARFPNAATVTGTRNNDVMHAYKAIQDACVRMQHEGMRNYDPQRHDKMTYGSYLGGTALLQSYADVIRFCAENCDSPYVPLLFERQLMYVLTPRTALDWLPGMVSPSLHGHPYYKSLMNALLARNMGVGELMPDIKLPLRDGTSMMLSELRGGYVLLDFWASWCAPCRKEMPYIIKVWEKARESGNLTIVSFSLDNKLKAWEGAISSLGIEREGWIHASDLRAWNSPAADALSVDAVPKSILIDPEGRIIAFDLRGDELVDRVGRILDGEPLSKNR